MAEVDGASPSELIQDFREAIGLLRAEEAGTIIGQALHYAAELLHKHGHPGNERLIVLISDGADWQPKEDKTTGEMHGGLEDPVSLMIHLHENLGIRLHAIGISNRAIFDPWFRENHPRQGTARYLHHSQPRTARQPG
jgi:Mg-chelatase subunit ChlD